MARKVPPIRCCAGCIKIIPKQHLVPGFFKSKRYAASTTKQVYRRQLIVHVTIHVSPDHDAELLNNRKSHERFEEIPVLPAS